MGTSPVVAYVWALAICLVMLLIAAIVAIVIPNKPGGQDIRTRRVAYWICFVIMAVAAFCINMWLSSDIKIPSKHDAYVTASAIATGVAALLYIVIGLILSKGMKRSKLGSWF